ncbi:MAG: hypothetical protein JW940_22815 [Polyangiaceae bacterium]|nr:hypothetical protein [Polyangiaceae bacterium]
MTTPSIEKVGLVFHFSEVGDWALAAALQIARARTTALNVYYFLQSPYEVPYDLAPADLAAAHFDSVTLTQQERRLREYFEERLGDFEDVRFRVCESGRHNQELRRCLMHREYQLLVIPCPRRGVGFGNMPIEEFAYRFASPVMLVGPERADEVRVNSFASVLDGSYALGVGPWQPIPEPQALQTRSVL